MWFEKIVLEMYVYLKLGKLYKHKPFFSVWQTSQSPKLPLLLFIIFFVWSYKLRKSNLKSSRIYLWSFCILWWNNTKQNKKKIINLINFFYMKQHRLIRTWRCRKDDQKFKLTKHKYLNFNDFLK